jgi:hypothetical protein
MIRARDRNDRVGLLTTEVPERRGQDRHVIVGQR